MWFLGGFDSEVGQGEKQNGLTIPCDPESWEVLFSFSPINRCPLRYGDFGCQSPNSRPPGPWRLPPI